ncbi:hypothetical protein AVEN_169936-1 [Araneus ventricosus]|nr:hypothetical protein AVEN_122850-1 [Araneus ventricosus]GBN94885.1 hypothetical protein AVEN_169936-1 [Araneus ventricosus]
MMKEMKTGQEKMKAGLEKKMEDGQEGMEQVQEEIKDLIRARKDLKAHAESQVEGIKDHVNGCIGRIEEEVQGVKLKIEEVEGEIHMKIEELKSEVQEKMSDLERRINDLELRPNNFPANPEFMHFRPRVKPLTFDMQTSWIVFKTQFDVVNSTDGWTNFEKTSKLVTSLRGSAAEVLQGIPADKLMDLTTIENALESRFGASHLTQFYRTELKTRRQRPRESLQVLSADVERLMSKCRGKGSICGIQCLIWVDTGENVTLLRTDLTQKFKEQLIYTAPSISFKIASGEETEIHGKLDASFECGSRKFHHRIYVADITDPCIFGLELLFSASAQHSKSCSVLAKKRPLIPARSECLNQVVPEVSGQFKYAVTDFPSQVSPEDILVAATLVDLERKVIPVRVLNLKNKPKILDKGAVTATYELVIDIVVRPQEFSGAQHLL